MTSAATENELARDIGGYEHVAVVRNIRVVDEVVVENAKRLPRGTIAGDCILVANFFFCFCHFILIHTSFGSLTGFSS